MQDRPFSILDSRGLPYESPLDTRMAVTSEQGSVLSDAPPAWQLWTHPFRAWNPDALQLAKDQADQGNYEFSSDLWESMLADDRISGAIEQRILASEALPLSFVGSPRSVKKLERWWKANITPGLRADLFRWGMGVGVVPLYVRSWKDGEPTSLEVWHPRWLRYYWWERRWKIITVNGLIDLSSQPGRWFLFTPFGSHHSRPHITGFWYSIATWWMAKAYAIPDWANFGQQHASPKWFMEQIEGNATIDKAAKASALKWLARIPSRSSMFVPYPFKVSQYEITSQAWSTYEREVDKANAAAARRILGHEASMDKDATNASGLTALDVKMSLVRYDVDSEREFWRTGLISAVATVQGWSGETPYPDRDTTPPEDLKAASETQKTAAEALATLADKGLDGDVDHRAFLGRYFPLRELGTGAADETAPTDGIQLSMADLDGLPDECTVRGSGEVFSLVSGDPGESVVLETSILLGSSRTDFPVKGDDLKVSLRNSQYSVFDPKYVDTLKEEWPEIWKAGGNIRGNDQYRKLRPIIARGGSPETASEESAVRLREAWAARHYRNNRLAGVVALMKWFVVGEIGQTAMKDVVEEAKDRVRARRKNQDSRSDVQLMLRSRKDHDIRKQARDGLGYRDTVTDELGSANLTDDAAIQILRVLADANGYEDARRRLAEAFPTLDRSKLRDLLTGGLLLTQAAGALTAGREAE